MGEAAECTLDCHDAHGNVVAKIGLAGNNAREGRPAAILIDEASGKVALRERENYDYRIESLTGAKFTLMPDPGVEADRWDPMRGKIRLGDYCGELVLRLTERENADATPVATAQVTVRSVKMNYESHYRTMLTDIGRTCAALLVESGSPARLRLRSEWNRNPESVEQQLEFLRHLLDTTGFDAAIGEVLRHPHRRLEPVREIRDISRPFKAGKDFGRQIATARRRIAIPDTHPLHEYGVTSLPAKVSVTVRHDDFDTAENRFVKLVLTEYRDFLSEIQGFVTSADCGSPGRESRDYVLRETDRLLSDVESRLARGFLPDVDMPEMLPLGSPVLQRKAGYRELLRGWLQFHAGSMFSWDESADVFHAGARNVAKLYEYWLFFRLHALFQKKFVCDSPLHESLIVKNPDGFSSMSLRRDKEKSLKASGYRQDTIRGRKLRPLCAELHFNRKFNRNEDRRNAGSWTRGVQPDFTLSLWPSHFGMDGENPKALEAAQAEALELMVHIHFDAKYRVENITEILGDEKDDESYLAEDETEPESSGKVKSMSRRRPSAKYQDLLKMHAYRDAIRRTAGAYVLYPGDDSKEYAEFPRFHEILPGLGAFAIRPRSAENESEDSGEPDDMAALEGFIDKVIEHLSDRTTARERSTYHLAESYPDEVREEPASYNVITLPETDIWADTFRAPPPADEPVLVAWYKNPAQRDLARRDDGFYYVRLGSRNGALPIHPDLSKIRRILLHSEGNTVMPGMLLIREQGFEVFTRNRLREKLKKANAPDVADWFTNPTSREDEDFIYACFKTKTAPFFEEQAWDGLKLEAQIRKFEETKRIPLKGTYFEPFDPKKDLPKPRFLSLRDVLIARK